MGQHLLRTERQRLKLVPQMYQGLRLWSCQDESLQSWNTVPARYSTSSIGTRRHTTRSMIQVIDNGHWTGSRQFWSKVYPFFFVKNNWISFHIFQSLKAQFNTKTTYLATFIHTAHGKRNFMRMLDAIKSCPTVLYVAWRSVDMFTCITEVLMAWVHFQ